MDSDPFVVSLGFVNVFLLKAGEGYILNEEELAEVLKF